ncbi:hypothetical protein AGLY_003497 [Aphis glycines]|uniref:Uncharacterized protein n=1 Tax=Aphis glycines TaxID=307491 RepID=A0A6G0U0Q8_APHGL|nr:hypothetical protein AGLY_003497 [Aphis glycines]
MAATEKTKQSIVIVFRKYEVITKKYLRTKDFNTNKNLDILYLIVMYRGFEPAAYQILSMVNIHPCFSLSIDKINGSRKVYWICVTYKTFPFNGICKKELESMKAVAPAHSLPKIKIKNLNILMLKFPHFAINVTIGYRLRSFKINKKLYTYVLYPINNNWEHTVKEKQAFNPMSNNIPNYFNSIEVFGCRFHLGQAWFRKIQNIGYASQFNSVDNVGKWLINLTIQQSQNFNKGIVKVLHFMTLGVISVSGSKLDLVDFRFDKAEWLNPQQKYEGFIHLDEINYLYDELIHAILWHLQFNTSIKVTILTYLTPILNITSRNNAPISNYGVVSDVKFKFLRNLSKTRKFAMSIKLFWPYQNT